MGSDDHWSHWNSHIFLIFMVFQVQKIDATIDSRQNSKHFDSMSNNSKKKEMIKNSALLFVIILLCIRILFLDVYYPYYLKDCHVNFP